MRALGLAVMIGLLAGPALAQNWVKKFGDIRAYHRDWIAVCEDEGRGACRLVQSAPDPGSDSAFDQRISVQWLDRKRNWAIQVMDRGMPESALSDLWFDFDGTVVPIPSSSYIIGEIDFANVAETITITDPVLAADLVERMRAGTRLTIQYTPQGTGNGRATISLLGFTSGSKAILTQKPSRR